MLPSHASMTATPTPTLTTKVKMDRRFRTICRPLGCCNTIRCATPIVETVRSLQRERAATPLIGTKATIVDESDGEGAYLMRGDVGISSIYDDLFNMREEDRDDRDESEEEDDDEVGLPIRLQHLAICPRHVSHPHFQGRLVVHEQCYPRPRPS
jgi:hypothetical protein